VVEPDVVVCDVVDVIPPKLVVGVAVVLPVVAEPELTAGVIVSFTGNEMLPPFAAVMMTTAE
jgi:hypothetical protein